MLKVHNNSHLRFPEVLISLAAFKIFFFFQLFDYTERRFEFLCMYMVWISSVDKSVFHQIWGFFHHYLFDCIFHSHFFLFSLSMTQITSMSDFASVPRSLKFSLFFLFFNWIFPNDLYASIFAPLTSLFYF